MQATRNRPAAADLMISIAEELERMTSVVLDEEDLDVGDMFARLANRARIAAALCRGELEQAQGDEPSP
jgi:hypothetical protein